MIVIGQVTKFDHVSHYASVPNPATILIQFDGEWDLWFTKIDSPHPSQILDAAMELKEYYSRDWKGSGRKLRVLYSTTSMGSTEFTM